MLPFMGSISFLLGIFVFFLGLSVGSFLNVVIMRSLRGEDFMWGRSHCDQCNRDLQWWEMIPVFSFVFLQGRCRTCKKEIDIMHPVVELLTGLLFLWWWVIGFAFFQLSQTPLTVLQPLFWLIVGIVLLVIALVDLRSYIIPDWGTLLLFVITLLYRVVLILTNAHQPQDFAWALFGSMLLLLFFLMLWLITAKKGIGFGDVKLIFPLGLLMGWPSMFVGVFLAFVIGAIVGVALLLSKKTQFGKAVPFGPFLILGTFLSLLYGDSLLRWYLSLL